MCNLPLVSQHRLPTALVHPFLSVEPHTGITVRGARRIQLSSWFGPRWKPIDGGVTPTYLPIFWADEASEVSGDGSIEASRL